MRGDEAANRPGQADEREPVKLAAREVVNGRRWIKRQACADTEQTDCHQNLPEVLCSQGKRLSGQGSSGLSLPLVCQILLTAK